MSHRSIGSLILLLLLSAPCCLIAQQAQPPLSDNPATAAPSSVTTLQTKARLVLLDVVVTDGHGHPVTGLKQSDFILYEDGVSQKLASFKEHTPAAPDATQFPAEPKLPPNTFIDHAPISSDRTMTVLLFDQVSFANDAYLRNQMLAFLKTVPPGTPIAIFRLSPQLRLIQDFTTDPQVLQAAISSKRNQFRFPPLDPFGYHYLQTQDSMTQLARYLSAFPGRKNLIWFSAGLPPSISTGNIGDPFPDINTFTENMTGVTDTLTLSRVALYPVDARGLVVSRREGFEILSEDGDLQKMATATGGKAFYSTNGFKQAVAEVVDTGSHYYTISYSPSNTNWNGAYRHIKVVASGVKSDAAQKVADWFNGTVKLEYRRGYYARDARVVFKPAPASKRKLISYSPKGDPDGYGHAKETPMHAAMGFGSVAPFQILFTAQVTPSAGAEKIKRNEPLPEGNFLTPQWRSASFRNYRIHYSVDPKDIQLVSARVGSYYDTIEFDTVIYDDGGNVVNSIISTVSMHVDASGFAQMMRSGLGYDQTIAIPTKGDFFVREGVHDLVSDRIGALEIPAESIKRLPVQSTPPPQKQ